LSQLTDALDGGSCDAFERRKGWDPSRWLSDRRAAMEGRADRDLS